MDKARWNRIISQFQGSTILQTWEWAEFKSKFGWKHDYFIKEDASGIIQAAALILCREHRLSRFGPSINILYVPHGPLLDWSNSEIVTEILDYLEQFSKERKAAYIKIDPQIVVIEDNGIVLAEKEKATKEIINNFNNSGWLYSRQQIQFKNTFWIDLAKSEDQLLAEMKQKTRYNIRLAERKGVKVRQGSRSDFDVIYEMYATTSARDGFIIRPKEYYCQLWETFMRANMAVPLIAEVQNEPVGALFLFYFNKKSYYLYGMSRDIHREKMPSYLLQWEAIRLSKSLGCMTYDLWGAPDVFDPSDRMWGVYKFKEGLGGGIIQTIGAFDYPTSKFAYTIIQEALPKFQFFARKIRGKQIKSELDG